MKTWLYDILQSINEIESYYENKPKIFEVYVSDVKTKRAIERNLEIIGEAAVTKSYSKVALRSSKTIK